jgi:menaquinone-9 beta-reductase
VRPSPSWADRAPVDVIVAGGGPIGLAAAIEARLAGLTVTVCEPRAAPIDKACGEGLMPAALQALDRLGVRMDGRSFVGIRYLDDERTVEHRFAGGSGMGVRRTALTHALAVRAGELGATVEPARVEDIVETGDGVVVSGGLRSRWLLACDGLHSGVRRSSGLAARPRVVGGLVRAARYGIRQHYHCAPWSEFVEVHWTPDAEVYVTPVADDVVGVAVLGPRGTDYDAVIARTGRVAQRLHGAEVASTRRGAGPLWQASTRRVAGRVLLLGDAAR